MPSVALNASTIILEDNSATNLPAENICGGCPDSAYELSSNSLNFGDIVGNTATGPGQLGIQASGAVVTSEYDESLPLIIPD